MRYCRSCLFLAVALLGTDRQPVARAQSDSSLPKQHSGQEGTRPKRIYAPHAEYPAEALEKKIEGKVTLSIVVDANGRVSEAKALSGPRELFQAAIENVKQWQYEPPVHAPVTMVVEKWWGFPKECPAPVSEFGDVGYGGTLRNEKGLVLTGDDNNIFSSPTYFVEDRKAGATGEIILSLTVNAKGDVTNVRVVKAVSPHLDKDAVDTVRTWKYKVIAGNPEALPDDFQLKISYQAYCRPRF
jgi:TonB family protein